MAGAPDFTIDVPIGNAPSAYVQPIQRGPAVPDVAGVTAGARGAVAAAGAQAQQGEALAGVGVALTHTAGVLEEVKSKIERAQAQTTVATKTTDYLTQLQAIEQNAQQDPDFANASKTFGEQQRELERTLSADIPDPLLRGRAVLEWRRAGLSAGKRVQASAWTKEVDTNKASLDAQRDEAVRSAAAAVTPVERQAVIDRYGNAVKAAAAVGWISEQDGVQRAHQLGNVLDKNDAMELIRSDPAQAGVALSDPKVFPRLDPLERQQFINVAKSAADSRGQVNLTTDAAFNPAGAAMTAGRLSDPAHARTIFDRVVIPIESGGDQSAVSSKGALGITQIMPATARDMLAKSNVPGDRELAALSDAELGSKLKADQGLNYRLGSSYWNELTMRYGGNLPAMFAAYNAGPKRADAWIKQATEQFGPGYTAAQFQQVVDIKETKDYLGKAWKAAGADITGAGLSPEGALRAGHAVGAALNATERERIARVKEEASSAATLFDPTSILAQGNEPAPAELALWTEKQKAAAGAGDVQAAKRLLDYQERLSLRPAIKQAYATSPVVLNQTIDAEEARQASGPVTTADKNRLDAFKAVRDEVNKRAHSDPVTLLGRAGLAAPVAVDPAAAPEDPVFRAALTQRGAQAQAAQRIYQGSANALTSEETRALKERYAAAGPDEQFRLLQTLGQTLPERSYADTVSAVAGSDGVAQTVGRIARDRPALARDILEGAKLMATKEVNDKAALVRPAFAGKLGGQVYPDPDMQDAVANAALALYTARRAGNGTLYDPTDGAGIERAIEEVTGPIVKRNGRRTPIAPGIQPRAFSEALDNLTEQQVTAMGGAYGRNAQPIAARDLGDRAQLVPLQPGSTRYAVLMPTSDGKGAPVLTYEGAPLVFDMRQVAASAQVPLTPYQRGVRAARGAAWERLRQANEDAQQ